MVDGVRVRLTKRRKTKLANEMIDRALEGEINIDRDAINQAKLIDRESE